MKKLPIVLLAILMVFSLFSCAEPEVAPKEDPPVMRTVTFDIKDKDGNAIARDPETVNDGAEFTVPEDIRNGITVPDGSAFVIRNNGKQLYPGNKITVTSDITINCAILPGTEDLNIDKDGVVQAKTSGEYTGDIVIPEKTKDGNPVTGIGNSAFDWCENLTSITIPDGITSIGKRAFLKCENLTSITISDSVTSIGEDAFWSSGLTEINIPAKAKFAEYYGKYDNPFDSCSKLKTITVDSNNKTLQSQNNCILSKDGNTLITCASDAEIPAGVTEIGDFACSGMAFSSGTITIPDSVAYIGYSAFYNAGLTEIHIPAKAKFLEYDGKYDNPFDSCSKLKTITVDINNKTLKSQNNCILSKDGKILITCASDAKIPARVTEIGAYACSGMDFSSGTITIPDGVTSIGEAAFSGCENLTSITISDSVTSIEGWAFTDCTSMTSITIPKSVTSIGANAFSYCDELTTINIEKGTNMTGWDPLWKDECNANVVKDYTPPTTP